MQTWSADSYERDAAFVSDLADEVLALLAPQAGERILDLGCGDGRLTARLAATGAEVLGVDSSAELLARAAARGLRVEQASGEALRHAAAFDAVFSNAALHWMLRPERVIAGVHRALRPGGRFVAEFGGFGNVAAIRVALEAALRAHGAPCDWDSIWYFPTAEAYAAALAAGGFVVEEIALHPRPTRLEAGMEAWIGVFGDGLLAGHPPDLRAAVVQEATARLAPVLRTPDGVWFADYMRLRFRARRA